MNFNELSAQQLSGNIEMVKMTLADFTDAEMLVRPVAGANHTAWQLGHLIATETGLTNAVTPGAVPELPAGFADKFASKNAGLDDPKAFATKGELLSLFARQRAATIEWAKRLTAVDLDKPAPQPIRQLIPTVAFLPSFYASHVLMHLGQWQVTRRKLGKPILF
jgi:hypothetical protein